MRREDRALQQPRRLREVPKEVEGVREIVLLDGVQVRDEAVAPGHARVTGCLPGARQQESMHFGRCPTDACMTMQSSQALPG